MWLHKEYTPVLSVKKCYAFMKDAVVETLKSLTGISTKEVANKVMKDIADLHVRRMCRVEILFQILQQKVLPYKPLKDAL